MSDHELYEIARQRIDRRTRRWTLWSINLGVLILTLAALILLGNSGFATLAAAIFFGWVAIFTVHTIIAGLAESRDGSIENEVAKLRAAFVPEVEKPKRDSTRSRLEINDDGELVDISNWDDEAAHAKRSRNP